ncbi:hypothetical protein D9M71_557600 [compost metagenome]
MLDQRLQLGAVGLGQRLDGFAAVHLAAVAELQGQLAAVHLAFHAQPVGQGRVVGLGLAAALARRNEQRRLVELRIELAQVVEGDARLRQRGQGGAVAEMAQQAMAQALAGHGAQLFLDRLEGNRRIKGRAQLHREQAGEPADGAGQVDVVEQLFAAMAFELDQR